jgi:hypothetical protein
LNLSHKTAENMSDMMAENKERKGLERDTTMCGTPQAWFPMRNSRE